MKRLIIILAILASCDANKEGSSSAFNAQVIGFNAEKCGCCWGWVIEYNGDTIKTSDDLVGETVGYEISEPIPVFIELGEKQEDCSAASTNNLVLKKDYYKVLNIRK